MTPARSSTASTSHSHTPYSARLRSKHATTRPNYAEDDSDIDRALAEYDPSPKANNARSTTAEAPTATSAPSSSSTTAAVVSSRATASVRSANQKRRRSASGETSSSTVSDLDSDLYSDDGDEGDDDTGPNQLPAPTTLDHHRSHLAHPSTANSSAPSQSGSKRHSSLGSALPNGKKKRPNTSLSASGASATANAASGSAASSTIPSAAIAAPAPASVAAAAAGAPPATSSALVAAAGKPSRKVKSATPTVASLSEMPPRPQTTYYFDKSGAKLKDGRVLVADDGTTFARNDFVYLICEPPGEPYYIGRIMEFRHQVPGSNLTTSTTPESSHWPVAAIRVNWVYRPRDVQRSVTDTRLVYATMHSDICPISSIRGLCQVAHRDEIDNLDEFRKTKDSFWFNQAFDRFIHRWYEVIPTSHVINVPEHVKSALDAHWKYIIVEATKVKELTSAAKTCKRCTKYCASTDSVDCAVCHTSYHMNCVRPPLLKKPSRGFAWACAPCNRAQERRMEAERLGSSSRLATTAIPDEEPDWIEEEADEAQADSTRTTDPSAVPTSPESSRPGDGDTRGADKSGNLPVAEAEIAQAEMWQMRYLGLHCRLEDVLQYDDRAIYPRASSRLGPRHQAVVAEWFGQPVKLVKPIEIKKKGGKGGSSRKDAKAAAAAAAAEEASRPGWIQNEPVGYVARGDDFPDNSPAVTAKLLFKMPKFGEHSDRGLDEMEVEPLKDQGGLKKVSGVKGKDLTEEEVDAYVRRAREMAKSIGVPDHSVDYLDRALLLLQKNNYDPDSALKQLRRTDRVRHLRDPNAILTPEEKAKFEEGVALYGSELRSVRLHAGIPSQADVVRYYYLWKKTDQGREIWGGFPGRKGTRKKSELADPVARIADELADDQDDSAFDSEKAIEKRRRFQCKFCGVRRSRLWRRAPVGPGGTESGRGSGSGAGRGVVSVFALCNRCANLWRRYAVRWEDDEEIGKRVAQAGGRAWRRRIDEELLSEWRRVQEEGPGAEEEYDPTADPPPKKKLKKTDAPKELRDELEVKDFKEIKDHKHAKEAKVPKSDPRSEAKPASGMPSIAAAEKEMGPVESRKRNGAVSNSTVATARLPSPPRPPTPPEPPRFRILPCAVCHQWCDQGATLFICTVCRLHVHAGCYGLSDVSSSAAWACDMCANDRIGKETTSYTYECVLCPVSETEQELVEPASDRPVDRDAAVKFTEDYRLQQRQYGRPVYPREPLKRTAGNNWVHIRCAVWMPEVRFSNALAFEQAEGIPLIPAARFAAMCSVCSQRHRGACVECAICSASLHVGCAVKAGHRLAFFVQPVKSSRREGVSGSEVITLGHEQDGNLETGSVTALVICQSHDLTNTKFNVLHECHERIQFDKSGTKLTALQLYAQTYKQADLSVPGTTRKANLLDDCRRIAGLGEQSSRPSTAAAEAKLAALALQPCPLCDDKLGSSFVWVPIRHYTGVSTEGCELMCGRCYRRQRRDHIAFRDNPFLRSRQEGDTVGAPRLGPSSSRVSLAAALTAAAEAGRKANELGAQIRARARSPPTTALTIPPPSLPPALPATVHTTQIPMVLGSVSMPIPGPVPGLGLSSGPTTNSSPALGSMPASSHPPHLAMQSVPPIYPPVWPHRPPPSTIVPPVYIASAPNGKDKLAGGTTGPPTTSEPKPRVAPAGPEAGPVGGRDYERADRDFRPASGGLGIGAGHGGGPGRASGYAEHELGSSSQPPNPSLPQPRPSGLPHSSSLSMPPNSRQPHPPDHLPGVGAFSPNQSRPYLNGAVHSSAPHPQPPRSIQPNGHVGNVGNSANGGITGGNTVLPSTHPGHHLSPPKPVSSVPLVSSAVMPTGPLVPHLPAPSVHLAGPPSTGHPHPHSTQILNLNPPSHTMVSYPQHALPAQMQTFSHLPASTIAPSGPPSQPAVISSMASAPPPPPQAPPVAFPPHPPSQPPLGKSGGVSLANNLLRSNNPTMAPSQSQAQSHGLGSSLDATKHSTSTPASVPSRPEAKGASTNASLKNLLS